MIPLIRQLAPWLRLLSDWLAVNAAVLNQPKPTMNDTINTSAASVAANRLVTVCHGASLSAGWWNGPHGLRVDELLRNPANNTLFGPVVGPWVAGAVYAQKIALVHSELSESLEGDRKSLPDDKLPQYPMRVVEIADAMIRAADLAGAVIPQDAGYTLGDVVAAKLAYNAQRADHKPENRSAAGGKAY